MSTYISGITDYIPQIQPFTPDYNFMSNILQTKQSRYDQGYKQVSKFYGTLLNAPMLREDNIQKRDEFFKNVDSEIQKLSGLDLSLQQNQDYAMQIFKPYYEDKGIIKDMQWTKNLQGELDRAEGFRTGCIDPKKCGGEYWKGGVDYLSLKAEEFKTMDSKEALGFEDAYYHPAQNVMRKAQEDIKAAGFEIKVDSQSGGYIVTTKNGKDMIAPLTDYLKSMYGSDPAVLGYYNALGYLDYKGYSAQEGSLQSEQDLLMYQDHLIKKSSDSIVEDHQKTQQVSNDVDAMYKSYKDYIDKNGVLDNEKDIINGFIDLKKQQQLMRQATAVSQNGVNLVKNLDNNKNTRMYGDKAAQISGLAMLNRDLGLAAQAYSMLTVESTMKADPFALQTHSAELAFQKAIELMPYQDQQKAQQYRDQKLIDRELEEEAGSFLKDPLFRPEITGTSTTPKPELSQSVNKNQSKAIDQQVTDSKLTYINTALANMQTAFKAGTQIDKDAIMVAAKEMFKHTGKDPMLLLNGKATLGDINPKLLDATYSLTAAQADIRNKSNASWNVPFEQQKFILESQVQNQMETQSIFKEEMVKENEKALVALRADYKDSPEKLLLVQSMLESVDNTYIPDVKTEGDVYAQAYLFAQKHGDKFEGGKDAALVFASKNAKDIRENWDSKYQDNVLAYNQFLGGKTSNAPGTGAYELDLDPTVRHKNNETMKSIGNNFMQDEDKIIANFGTMNEIQENNPVAKALIKQYFTDFNRKEKKAYGTALASRIGGMNDNYMAVTINPSNEWLKDQQSTKASPTGGIIPYGDDTYKNGITFFIPKNEQGTINNQYYQSTEYNTWDYILDKKGQIDITKDSGRLTLQKVEGGYSISGYLDVAKETETGYTMEKKLVTAPIIYGDLDGSDVYDTWQNNLLELQMYNNAVKTKTRSQYGIKDIKQIEQSITNPG
jgi:hypothetical protein